LPEREIPPPPQLLRNNLDNIEQPGIDGIENFYVLGMLEINITIMVEFLI